MPDPHHGEWNPRHWNPSKSWFSGRGKLRLLYFGILFVILRTAYVAVLWKLTH